MYIRIVQFKLAKGSRAAAEEIANKVVPVIRAQPGCDRSEFFADDSTGDYGVFAIWATKADAETAPAYVMPVLSQAMAEAQSTNNSRQLFEIIEPRA